MLAFSTRVKPVGTHQEAEQAVRGEFSQIDRGLFKRVYVNPDHTYVYKVTRPGRDGDRRVDRGRKLNLVAEAAWSASLRKAGVRGIPPVSLWIIDGVAVLSMPYYPEPGGYDLTDAEADYIDRLYGLGLDDLHEGNYRRDKRGAMWIIDLGGWADNYPDNAIPDDVTTAVLQASGGSDDEYDDDEDGDCGGCGDYECWDCYPRCGCGDGCPEDDCPECADAEAEDDNASPDPACEQEHEGWVCVRDYGHLGQHESVMNIEGVPFHVWQQIDGLRPYEPDKNLWCGSTKDGFMCTLRLGHASVHAAHQVYGENLVLDVWAEPAPKVKPLMPVGSGCGADAGPDHWHLVCTLRGGHYGPHEAWGVTKKLHEWPRTPVVKRRTPPWGRDMDLECLNCGRRFGNHFNTECPDGHGKRWA
jgi:hypothetical protein